MTPTDERWIIGAFVAGMFIASETAKACEKIGRWMEQRRTPANPRSPWETR